MDEGAPSEEDACSDHSKLEEEAVDEGKFSEVT